ncbi:MAG: hypothetical protein ABSG17_11310 [Spirochaetia bacterium]|jgi:hypothetical protein
MANDQSKPFVQPEVAAERGNPADLAARLLDAEAEGTLYAIVVSGNVSVVVPWACELIDMAVLCTASHASGTIQAKQGANAITDAVICATQHALTRAATMTQGGAGTNVFAAGATLTLVTANTPAGKVTLNFKKYQTAGNTNADGT